MSKRKMPREPKRFALYSRVSTDEQSKKENSSIEVQHALAERYALQFGEVVAAYQDDVTGTHLNRPGYKQLLADAAKGDFDCVVITFMSRLGRDGMFIIAEHELAKLGVSIRATEEDFVNNPEGVVMKAMTQMMDTVYIEQIRKFTSTKMKEMVRQGFCVGCLPFGLTSQPTSDHPTAPKIIIHDPETSKSVEVCFDLFIETRSLAAVRDFLSAASNRKWTTTSAKNLLQNRIYLGELRFGDWANLSAFPPVVSVDTFDAVQKVLGERQNARAPRSSDYEYLLRGLIHCPHCGCPYTNSMAKGGSVRYYECYRDKKKLSKCPVGRVNCDTLHKTVLETVAHLARHPVAMHEAIKQSKSWEVPSDHLLSQRAQIGKALQVAGTRQSNLLNAIESGIEVSSIVGRLKEVEQVIQDLKDKAAALDVAVAEATKLRPTAREVQESWSEILSAWGFATDDEKSALIRLVVERVEIKAKDRAKLRLTSIVELSGRKFGITENMGAGARFELATSGL